MVFWIPERSAEEKSSDCSIAEFQMAVYRRPVLTISHTNFREEIRLE